jgi:L-lactate dehydrogenase (cytochrome)
MESDRGGYSWGVTGDTRAGRLRRAYPTIEDLRRRAKRRVPCIGFDVVEGGTDGDLAVRRNMSALDAIELVPRVGGDAGPVSCAVSLFGTTYASPIGIAPMGLQALTWPGAERHLAAAAQAARIPYTAGTAGGVALEELAALAPDVFWFQLYRLAGQDHKYGLDLVQRAERAGAKVLMLTLDVPARAKRPRELRNGLVLPFRPDLRTVIDAALSPAWLMAMARHGPPAFANFAPYVGDNPTRAALAGFAQREVCGAFTWEEVARYRDAWRGPLVIKGVMHPADADKARAVGADGVLVSNHGGRQFEAAPAPVDVLPAIAVAVGERMTVLVDGGIRSGTDILRTVSCGAAAALAGRAFLYGVAALGEEGARYVVGLLIEETATAVRQAGIRSLEQARMLVRRHPGAMQF